MGLKPVGGGSSRVSSRCREGVHELCGACACACHNPDWKRRLRGITAETVKTFSAAELHSFKLELAHRDVDFQRKVVEDLRRHGLDLEVTDPPLRQPKA